MNSEHIESALTYRGTAIALVALAMAARLIILIHRYSVNVFFHDEWDFCYFLRIDEPASFWRSFSYQYGPMRMGLGLNLIEWLLKWTRYDSRALAYAEAGIFITICLAALLLKKRLFGKLSWPDLLIPIVVLSLAQSSTLFSVHNLSHGPLPILFIMLYALALTIRNFLPKILILLSLNFLMVYSQAGISIAPITPWLITWLVWKTYPAGRVRAAWILLSWSACLVTLGIYFHGYLFRPAVNDFQVHVTHPVLFAQFLGTLLLDGFWRSYGSNPLLFLAAMTLLFLGISVTAARLITHGHDGETAGVVIITFLLFSAFTALLMTYGRISLGIEAARANRYHPYFLPMILAIYFFLCTLPSTTVSRLSIGIYLMAFVVSELRYDARSLPKIQLLSRSETAWAECYRTGGSIDSCNAQTGFSVYPAASEDFQRELDYLRKNSLGFFKE